MKIKIGFLRDKVMNTLLESFSREDSIKIADYLIWADMSGISTQGISKLTGTEPLQGIKPKHEIKIERDTKLSQLINAGAHPAPLVSQLATEVLINKAKQSGFAIVSVHNTFSSNGAQAYYAEQIAKADLIGIVMSRSPGSTAPFSSIEPLFGTNPIGFSFPTLNEPIVFDMATSAITFYGLIIAQANKEKIAQDLAIDKNGNPTTDPSEAIKGAILPFDRSYKGSGLSMVVELLAGPLASSAFCDYKTFDQEWGSTFIAIDPELLVDINKFKNDCTELITIVRNSKSKTSDTEIRLPGERAFKMFEESKKTGMVDIEESTLKQLGYIENETI